jgi:23S rRNA pseudouridine2605 synthase
MRHVVQKGERIAKVIAHAGLCSRRDAEKWIADGRVSVNGKTITSPALNILPSDRVIVDGKPVSKENNEPRLFRYHKPAGLVTSHRDDRGRETVFDNLPDGLPRLISVGRLDLNTEGLLLLTNNGDLSRYLELPSTGWVRRYRVRAHGMIDQAQLDSLKKGVEIEGVKYAPIEAVIDRTQGANTWMTVSLKEGKNREIRRVMEHLGVQVNRLIRLSYGPFQLGNLKKSGVEEVKKSVLKDQIPEFFKK